MKFKTDLQSLDMAQSKTVEDMQAKVYRLLGETPPNGPDFARSVKRMMGREEAWNKWKNNGCPRYGDVHDDVCTLLCAAWPRRLRRLRKLCLGLGRGAAAGGRRGGWGTSYR